MFKKNIKYLLLFLFLSLFSLVIYEYQTKKHQKSILDQEKEILSMTYATILKAYQTHSEIFLSTKINVPEVIALMQKANGSDVKEKNKAREALYAHLIDGYNSMKIFKIKQLHFHLPNSESFLRFHRPQKYGDSLIGVRDTVVYVNKHKEPVAGFEEGKIYNGYRYIYPLLNKGEHYGSVEISVSMQEIIQKMRDEAIANIEFIIKKDIVDAKLFEDERKNYAPSNINEHFYYERSISGEGDKAVETMTANNEELQKTLLNGSVGSFITPYKKKVFVTTVIPIYNKYAKKHVANIVVSRPNPSLEYMMQKDKFIQFVIIVFLTLLVYAYYRVETNTQNLKQKNKTLKEIQHIAKLGSWELDGKTNKIFWSDEIYNIFKSKPNSFEPTYEKFLSFVHPKDRERVNRAFLDSIESKSKYQIRHRIVRTDDIILYVDEAGYHTFDAKGEHIKTVGTVHDVTDTVEYEEKISHIQSELESIIEHIPDIVFRCKADATMSMLFINSAVEKITGYKAKGFLFNTIRNYRDLIYPDDKKITLRKIEKALAESKEYSLEYRIVNSIGDIVWVRESAKKIETFDKEEIIEGLITDITAQKNAMDKLRKFIDIQDSIVFLTDTQKVLFANRKFFAFFGYENVEEFTKNHDEIVDLFLEDKNFFHKAKMLPKEDHWVRSLLNLPGRERIVSLQNAKGKVHTFSVSINNYDPHSYIINLSDISDTMFEKLQLEEKALKDQLTGAYNRNYFDSAIENIMKQHEKQNISTGVILLDIDHFKEVNDNYGHDVGDEVLKTLVKVIIRYTRKEDKLVRWGGEEFIIIMNAQTVEDVYRQAEHLRLVIENHVFEEVEHLTCSFGIALHQKEKTIKETIKQADEKLYVAKKSGRNRVEF